MTFAIEIIEPETILLEKRVTPKPVGTRFSPVKAEALAILRGLGSTDFKTLNGLLANYHTAPPSEVLSTLLTREGFVETNRGIKYSPTPGENYQ